MEHLSETRNTCGGERFYRARGDGIDPDPFWPQVVRQITHARFQRRLGHTHDIVMGNNLFRSHIRHSKNRTLAPFHQRGCMARQNHQRISAHVQCQVKSLAARLNIGIGEIFFGGIGDSMDQDVQPAPFFAQSIEDLIDLLIFGDVARKDDLRPNPLCQRSYPLFQNFARVGKGELRALPVERLGNRPGDAPFVGDTEDHCPLTVQNPHSFPP